MKQRALALLAPLLVALTLAGCGSCQRPEESSTPQPAAPPQAEAPAAAAEPAAEKPAGEVPQPPAEMLEDCFVFVDAEPDYGEAPLTAHFTTELECDDRPVTYSWDFGDGSTGGNEPNPSHTYAKVGDYVAVVTVTGDDGSTGSDEIDIFVEEASEE